MSLGSLIYRTLGAWGAGLGRNLTAAEVDGNFWAIAQAFADLDANPPQANSIANVTQSGNSITVWMQDGSSFGPFSLPTASSLTPVAEVSGSTYTLLLADRGKYLRCTGGGGCAVVIPPSADLAVPTGAEYHFEQATSASISFEGGCDVLLRVKTGFYAATALQYSAVTLKKVDDDEWVLIGELSESLTS